MAKIFIRERNNVSEGEGRPRFAVVGVEGTDMKFFKTHLRKSELDAIVQSIGAELVTLPHGTGEHANEQGHGRKHRHGRHGHGQGGDAETA